MRTSRAKNRGPALSVSTGYLPPVPSVSFRPSAKETLTTTPSRDKIAIGKHSEVRKRQAFYSPMATSLGAAAPNPPEKGDGDMQKRTRNKAITLRMTEDEYNFFQGKMETAKQKNQTDFFLAVLRKRKIMVVEDLRPALIELKRQGNNLSQIARQLHEGTEFGAAARRVMNECWKAYRALLALSERVG